MKPKHHASPNAAITAAPTAGPTMRARLKPLEFSAIASYRSSRSTSSIISDCRAGISNAENSPFANASPISHPIVMCPVSVSAHSATASASMSACIACTTRSRSARST